MAQYSLLSEVMPSLTLKTAIKALQAINMVLRKRDGEYRVNFKGGAEVTAYYTNDLQDAVDTAFAMHRRGNA